MLGLLVLMEYLAAPGAAVILQFTCKTHGQLTQLMDSSLPLLHLCVGHSLLDGPTRSAPQVR